ncbi:hypothetical protein DFS28_107154 [Pseudomonas sp. 478]|nr:hypothetical protein DFS28_107154 [Pseudomonas sp. 478]TCV50942.1 hypothetical protein EDB99_108156 [Pseudomonas sp. 460]
MDALRPLWDAERPGLHSHAERGNDLTRNIERAIAIKVCSLYRQIHRSKETLTCHKH